MCISAISLICLEKTPIAPIANEWWWSASAMWWRRILFTTANAVSVENLLPEFGSSILLFKTSLIPWDIMRHSMVAVEQMTFLCCLLGFPHPSPKCVNDAIYFQNCVMLLEIK